MISHNASPPGILSQAKPTIDTPALWRRPLLRRSTLDFDPHWETLHPWAAVESLCNPSCRSPATAAGGSPHASFRCSSRATFLHIYYHCKFYSVQCTDTNEDIETPTGPRTPWSSTHLGAGHPLHGLLFAFTLEPKHWRPASDVGTEYGSLRRRIRRTQGLSMLSWVPTPPACCARSAVQISRLFSGTLS